MSYARFKRSRYYLLDAHAKRAAALLSLAGLILLIFAPSREHVQLPWLIYSLLLAFPFLPLNVMAAVGCVVTCVLSGQSPAFGDLPWVFGGVVLGLYSATIMHICAHGSPKSRVWRSVLGELCAMQQLTGFQDWTVVHMMHHANSDHPLHDPHYASGTGFFAYAAGMKLKIALFVQRYYLNLWQGNPNALPLWAATAFFIVFSNFAASVLWLVLLGPKMFTLVFVTSLLTNSYFYCHFNYFTHQPNQRGEIEILNLQTGLYRILNGMLLGIFFHKNHHDSPMQLNPAEIPQEQLRA